MMNIKYGVPGLALFFFLFFSPQMQAQKAGYDPVTASESIDYDYFFKHLKYLASDELRGRGIGTPDYTRAANYVAGEFEKIGLLPFGDSSTYFQEVVLSKPSVKKGSFTLKIATESAFVTAGYGSEVSVVLNPAYKNVDEEQQLAFVGYGNIIPGKNINDYDGVDVKGKTVIVALGGPKGIEHPAFNDRNAKFENAASAGASGIILFYPKADLFQSAIFRNVHGFLSEEMLFLADSSIDKSVISADLKLLFFAKKKFIKDLFTLNGLSLKQELRYIAKGKNASRELGATLHCYYDLDNDPIISQNVVALLPGADAELKREYVVLGSHLDHLGVGEAVKGDSIYNGMLDNASGVSALLSISKTFCELAEKPRRSIIFICYTAEENGTLGSNYFANKNNVNNGTIVTNINIDMLSQTIETVDITPLGYAHSNLSEAADFAASALNLKIDDNRQAEIDYIERSDQISFIKKGVPALFIAGGQTALDHRKDGKKVFDEWMDKTYHSPFDDLNQEYSDEAFLTAIRFNFLTIYYISNLLEAIKWNKDSWLYEKYILHRP